MRNRKRITSLVAGILAGALLLSLLAGLFATTVSAAKSSDEIQEEIDQLEAQKAENDKKLEDLQSQLSGNMEEMEAVVAEKSLIDQQITLLYEQMDNLDAQIKAYGQLVADKQAELDEAQAELDYLNEKNQERICAMEKNGQVSYWSVLFQATSFTDMLDRMYMVLQINQADKEALAQLDAAAQQVEAAKASLEDEMAALEESRQELDKTQEELDAKRADADELLANLVARGEEYEALVEQAEEDSYQMLLDIIQKENERSEAEQREYEEWLKEQEQQNPPAPGTDDDSSSDDLGGSGSAGEGNDVDGVTWLVPISYTYLSSPFGMRLHPVYGDYRLHNGVDLSAPEGTPIYASRAGQVIVATYGASGGNYVMIDHMDGTYTTMYLHMTRYVVSVGQNVAAGELIGYCGSTGVSTGPHLHFSVFKNGVAVNPADYIPI